MAIITEGGCGRLGRIIYILVKTKRAHLAAKLLKAFAFDPIAVMHWLERLEKKIANDEECGVADTIQMLYELENLPPPEH